MNSCYRHPDREANLSCQRCGRFICPDCMNDAAVGFQCPECVSEGRKNTRQPKNYNVRSISSILIAINIVVAVVVFVTGGSSSPLFQNGAMLSESAINHQGILLTGFVDGAWWRPFTSAFLHSGIMHLAFNMFAIYVFGPMLESVLGRARFLALYGLSIIGASIMVLYFGSPFAFTVGASGAIYGLFAMALIVLIRARQNIQFLLFLLAINIAISFTGSISWQAHFGGLIVGGLLGLYFSFTGPKWRSYDQFVIAALGLVMLGVLYAPMLG